MNYLAHLFFSKNTQLSLLGNLMGDFAKGNIIELYDNEIVNGVAQHRLIDKYTDNHPIVKISKSRISKQRRRYSGILIDIFYDHYLAKHWHEYSGSDIDTTIKFWHKELSKPLPINIPKRLELVIQDMIKYSWLQSYTTIEGIGYSVNRVAARIKFKNNLNGGAEELTNNYDDLENDFSSFFPMLIKYVSSVVPH